MTELKTHWADIHENKDKDVSWWQESLWTEFLEIIECDGAAIDVGSGQSPLAIEFSKAGFEPVFINDLAENALVKLAQKANLENIQLQSVPGNILDVVIPNKLSLWHDRAVFHFLTIPEEIKRYKTKVLQSSMPNSYLVVSTFSENGPDQCSGLNVAKYSPDQLANVFAPEFKVLRSEKRIHKTPWASEQEFSIAVMQQNEPSIEVTFTPKDH